MIWHRPFNPAERGFLMSGLLRLTDVIAVAVCALFAFWLRDDLTELPANYTLAVLLAVVLFANAAQIAKLYEFRAIRYLRGQFGRVTLTWMTVIVALIVVAYLTKTSDNFSRIWAMTWFASTSAMLIMNRLAAVHRIDRWRAEGKLTRRLAIVGEGARAERIKELATRTGRRDTVLAGVYAPRQGNGGLDDLLATVAEGKVDEIVIALDAPFDAEVLRNLVRTLGTMPVEVRFAPDTQDLPFPVLGTSEIGGIPLFDVHHRPLSVWSRVVKRIRGHHIGQRVPVAAVTADAGDRSPDPSDIARAGTVPPTAPRLQ